ncbi:unnamed protein product [Effrenium voratum]|nr:unnamed protein product [Effrenium voratum]
MSSKDRTSSNDRKSSRKSTKGRKGTKERTAAEVEKRLAELRKKTACGGLAAETDSDSDEDKAPSVPSIVTEVQAAMQSYKQSRGVQEHSCAIIRNLACSDEWLSYIEHIDGTGLVLAALERFKLAHLVQERMSAKESPHFSSVQEQGLGAISNLASKSQQRGRLNGAMSLVQTALIEHSDKAGACAQACAALWNLVADHKENQALVDQLQITQKVCEAIEVHLADEEVLENAFGAISNFTSFNLSNKQAVVDVNGAGSICRGMQEHLTATPVQRQGCAALWSLAANSEAAQAALFEAKALSTVCRAMGSEPMDPNLQENGCGLVRNLTVSNEDCKVQAIQVGCAEKVCAALARHEDVRVRRQGCGALLNMASVQPEHVEECHHAIVQLDGVSRLCLAISSHLKEVSVVEPACGALRALASGAQAGTHGPREKILLHDELVPHVIRASFVNLEFNLVQRHCLEALRHVCDWESGAAEVNAARGALATCRAMARQWQDPVVQERGCGILKGLAGVKDGPASVVSAGGLARIAAALRSFREERGLQLSAFEALLAMSKEAAQDVEASGCRQAMLLSMPHQDFPLLVVGCGVLRNLALGDVAAVQEARQLLTSYLDNFPDEVDLLVASLNALAEICILEGPNDADATLTAAVSSALVAHKKVARVQAAGLNVFRAMAVIGNQSLDAALEARCIERARLAFTDHRGDEAVQARGCELLRRVAASAANLRDSIVEAGLFALITEAQENCKDNPEVCRQSIHATATLLGFMSSTQSRQEERMRMMKQSAAKAKAAAAQKGAAAAHGKLVKETDLTEFVTGVQKLMLHHKNSSLFLQDACHVLHSLADNSDDGRKAVHAASVLDTVIAALKQHRRCESVTFHGLRTLWSLLTGTAVIRHAVEAGAVEFAGAALSKFPNSAPVQSAALLVVNRTCVKNTEVKQMYLEAGLIPSIQRLQAEAPSTFLRGRCLATLANLASNFPEAAEQMRALGVVEAVVDRLCTDEDEQILCRCLQLLWAFLRSSRNKQHHEKIGTMKVLDAVLRAVDANPKNENLQAPALGFLWNFGCLSKERTEWLQQRGAVQKVCLCLDSFSDSPTVQRHGLELLRCLSCPAEFRTEVYEAKAVDLAKAALFTFRRMAQVACAAVGLLGNLACGGVQFKREMFEQDVPKEVLAAMEEHARDAGVQALGSWALGNLVGVSRKRARELFELGGKDRVFLAMSEHTLNDSIKMYGTSIVRRLELVQDLTQNSANMEEDDEPEKFEAKSFADLDKDESDSESDSEISDDEDPELKAKIRALAQQTRDDGAEEQPAHRGPRSGVKFHSND